MRRKIGKKSSISYHSWLIAGSKKALQVNPTWRRCLRPRFRGGFRLSLDGLSIKWEKINPKRSRLLKTFPSALEFKEKSKLEVQNWILSALHLRTVVLYLQWNFIGVCMNSGFILVKTTTISVGFLIKSIWQLPDQRIRIVVHALDGECTSKVGTVWVWFG